jgi:ribosomal protein S27E
MRDDDECPICFDRKDIFLSCQMCSGEVCTDCYDQIETSNILQGRCPFCRNEYALYIDADTATNDRVYTLLNVFVYIFTRVFVIIIAGACYFYR